jgi:hypothetical protein
MKSYFPYIVPLAVAVALALVLGGEVAGQDKKAPEQPVLPGMDEKILQDPKAAKAAADLLEAAYQGKQPPEAVRMLLAILREPTIGPQDGWFGPAQTRCTWEWLAKVHGVDAVEGAITRKSFKGSDAQFAVLDRDKNGRITAEDLDWSEKGAYMQQTALARSWFRAMNTSGDGRLTKEQLLKFFDKAAAGKDAISFDEFRDALVEGRAGQAKGGVRPASLRAVLLRGLFNGEIGSMNEGPQVGQPAPNFTLKSVDGKQTIQLADHVGKKPVVLIFGNYTCGPFCSSFPAVEPVYRRFSKDANFLMVYVREAHPEDGWSAGMGIKQPQTWQERVSVAEQFCKKLSPAIPVLVDEINDPAGHTYSGMPSRLYVIDPSAKVAYKSGRGPYGFKIGEMEQALAMTLLESQLAKQPAAAGSGN